MKHELTLLTALLYATSVHAQTPTIVYGASETAPDEPDSYLLEQPADAPNPLGNPIPEFVPQDQAPDTNLTNPETPPETSAPKPQAEGEINQTEPQDPAPFSQSPEREQNEIENTLYEGGNRIYDVQSYPLEDIKTITEPNVDPTITTYPEY